MIYLDNAATSFPKPRAVIEETARCMREYGGNPGRGSHRLAMRAAEKIFECREEIASFFGSGKPENVVFTMNTTMALNMAIKGIVADGDHVLISDMEHNAVFRPIYRMAREGRIAYDVFPSFAADPEQSETQRTERICEEIERLIRPRTRAVVCTHASNICSAVMPIQAIGEVCRRHGILFIVDAAQSAGHLPIDVRSMKIDALCAPGHKGLLGPQGSGFLLLGEEVATSLATLMEGGSGVHSLDGNMPAEPPERYEAGTLPTPAVAGLCEGIRAVRRMGIDRIFQHERELASSLSEGLSKLPGVRIYAPRPVGQTVLFSAEKVPADRLGDALNRRGFCVRSGFHCAALAHRTLATPPAGAVRVSPGVFNTPAEISAFCSAVRELV